MFVLEAQCATCIFRPGNPMSLNKGRVKGMVEDCKRNAGHIPCHETMRYEDDDVDDDGGDPRTTWDSPVCRGFYDRYPDVSQSIQIARRLGVLRFIPAGSSEEIEK